MQSALRAVPEIILRAGEVGGNGFFVRRVDA